jgi:hypothetical protein
LEAVNIDKKKTKQKESNGLRDPITIENYLK